MEDWMQFDAMLEDVFQQPGAYPYPFGSVSLAWLEAMADEAVQRLSWGRLRDQAVSVDQVFAEVKGEYCALWKASEQAGLTPYLDTALARAARLLRDIQVQQRRLRALLDAAPQPRRGGRN